MDVKTIRIEFEKYRKIPGNEILSFPFTFDDKYIYGFTYEFIEPCNQDKVNVLINNLLVMDKNYNVSYSKIEKNIVLSNIDFKEPLISDDKEYNDEFQKIIQNKDYDSMWNLLDKIDDGIQKSIYENVYELIIDKNSTQEYENKKLEQLKNKQDYEFEIKGIFSDSVEGYFRYIKKDGKAEYSCSEGVDFLFKYALEKEEPIGPVGQYMERDINNPLAVLFILKTEVFDKIIEVKGELPEADEVPPEAIC